MHKGYTFPTGRHISQLFNEIEFHTCIVIYIEIVYVVVASRAKYFGNRKKLISNF